MTLASPFKTVSQSGGVLIRYGGGPSQFFTAQATSAECFLTAAITYQGETTKSRIDLAAATERVDGIVVGEVWPAKVDMDKDSDDVYDALTWLKCYRPIKGDSLYATVATATSIAKDGWVKYADGFLTTATDKDDAIGKLDNGGAAVTGVSATEEVVSIEWGAT